MGGQKSREESLNAFKAKLEPAIVAIYKDQLNQLKTSTDFEENYHA